jgi:hypothetical protein
MGLIETQQSQGRQTFDTFPVESGLKHRHALSPLLLNSGLAYAVRRFQANQKDLKLNGTHQLLVYAADDNIFGGSIHTIRKNTDASLIASKEIGLKVNAEKTKYTYIHTVHFIDP